MKDFFDIWSLATHFSFDGPVLALAVRETFRQRQTALQVAPVALTSAFVGDDNKQAQWRAFIGRHPGEEELPTLGATIQVIEALLQPVVRALVEGRSFDRHWPPGDPWLSPPSVSSSASRGGQRGEEILDRSIPACYNVHIVNRVSKY